MESKILSKRQTELWEVEDKFVVCKIAMEKLVDDCDNDYMQRESLRLLTSMVNICLSHLDLIKERNTWCLNNVRNAEQNRKEL